MQLDYTVQIWREGKQFVAHATPLDVASSGETPEAARNALHEAVQLFLSTAGRHGTLAEVLEDAGYELDGVRWRCADWISIEKHSTPVAA